MQPTRRLLLALMLILLIPIGGLRAEPDAKPESKHTNRLAKETSPYLLLHAHNPVDWYPWGEEALAKAKAEKKLIFLSIGYSSCYWCHVMERESFMDDEVAAKLNKNFICIKVDREERPDVDEIYMQALHVYLQLAGSKQGGGWPLSMFLTPDGKPLMGGTYFPPRDKDGRMGFATVLDRVVDAWKADPDKWQKTGDSLAEYVNESLRQRPIIRLVKPEPSLLEGVLKALAIEFDDVHGGFGFDPANPKMAKFPQPPHLLFLIDYARRTKHPHALAMLNLTLEKISLGGIRDHVGGGFHRYSTDRYWRVPHFEKMLYDNAQLIDVYTLAYELAPRPEYQRLVAEAIEFVSREMTDAGGGFYSALDAETNADEGGYYVWQAKELESLLSADELALVGSVYGTSGEPNFEGRSILLLGEPLSALAKRRKVSEDELERQLAPIRQKLLAERAKRQRPLTDIKIITGWNGLMIAALADAGRVFKNDAYTAAAIKAADFILKNLRDSQGRLQHSYAGGQAKVPAYLDDYAFLTGGLIALYKATGDAKWLSAAGELTDTQLKLFWDERVGGFFNTSSEHEQLFARSKAPTDSVMPSGNSAAAVNLVYLGTALKRPEYLDRAEKCFQAAAPMLDEHPGAIPQLAVALAAWLEAKSASAKPKQ